MLLLNNRLLDIDFASKISPSQSSASHDQIEEVARIRRRRKVVDRSHYVLKNLKFITCPTTVKYLIFYSHAVQSYWD